MATANRESRASCFEIGLVLAGALSAGCYTAGVVDFLIQALDQWEEAKRGDDPACPRHRVSIKVVAGASAGGMSAAIAAAQLGEAHTPADDPGGPGPSNNNLYDAWVRRVDITRFLETADIDVGTGGDVVSLLDSTVLDEIAAATFRWEEGPTPPARGYLADPLHVLLTVSTIQGTPYDVRFLGESEEPPRMTMHADHLHFALGDGESLGPDVRQLLPGRYDDPEWKAFSLTGLATGACPGLLAPRRLRRTMAEYKEREWPTAARRVGCDAQVRKVPPDFRRPIRGRSEFDVVAVDGGLNDNEPLKLARRILDGGLHHPREGPLDRAMIAIAPFPDLPTFTIPRPPPGGPTFLTTLAGALAGLVNQSRFDPEVAIVDRNPAAWNRYIISAKRDDVPEAPIRSHLAGGSVGGLGDFLAREFRAHDFQLGRRNCQQFLRDVFALPEREVDENPLLGPGWTREARQLHRFARGEDGRRRPPGSGPAAGDVACLPIVPLCGTAAREVLQMDWPRYDPARLDALRSQLEERTHAVIRCLIDRNITGRLQRLVLRGASKFLRRRLADKIIQGVAKDLRDRGLLG